MNCPNCGHKINPAAVLGAKGGQAKGAASKARAESYSQFVPGETGINILGFATEIFALLLAAGPPNDLKATVSLPCSAVVGNTFSSGVSHACRATSREIDVPRTEIVGCSCVMPRTIYSTPVNAASGFSSGANSKMIDP